MKRGLIKFVGEGSKIAVINCGQREVYKVKSRHGGMLTLSHLFGSDELLVSSKELESDKYELQTVDDCDFYAKGIIYSIIKEPDMFYWYYQNNETSISYRATVNDKFVVEVSYDYNLQCNAYSVVFGIIGTYCFTEFTIYYSDEIPEIEELFKRVRILYGKKYRIDTSELLENIYKSIIEEK